jgi:hypothetical protein
LLGPFGRLVRGNGALVTRRCLAIIAGPAHQ